MFKLSLCLIAALVVCAQAAGEYDNVRVVKSQQEVNTDGYSYIIELDNGLSKQQEGHLKGQGGEQAIVAQGSYSYVSPEGEKIQIQYTADENGYQPTGSHLPTPPPIPEAIQRSLDWIAAHPEPEKH